MDDHSGTIKYNDTRDLSKQQSIITDLYGSTGSTNLTSTYNTNALPNTQGLELKNLCMQYSDEQLNTMLNGTNATDKSLANECVVIRTVAVTNDRAIGGSLLSKIDPLYDTVKNRSLKNTATNSSVATVTNTTASINKANSQAYACDLEPTRTEYSSQLCSAKGLGRLQQCSQNRVIKCGTGVVGDRELAECIAGMDKGTIKLVSATNGRKSTFIGSDAQIFLNERWNDGSNKSSSGQWTITFLVKNPSKVDMVLQKYYFDNKISFTLNGTYLIGSDDKKSDGSKTVNMALGKHLVIGQNTLVVDMHNYAGPAAANFTITIGSSTYQGCSCTESWETTCNVSKVEL
ncbi:hypothetical protein HLH17_02150 [Acinetobacter sp. ANC 5380]|uniref:Uncharacterized protein n=1 Tax=Acinetobacter terrae TaxID=2731247 RepID=A0A7Y2W9V0_9GAMM|nr:hypothetical protein [Acinetobacter terrae]NNH76504.1 hypothetical protein [Acinetobacter terrae]